MLEELNMLSHLIVTVILSTRKYWVHSRGKVAEVEKVTSNHRTTISKINS